MREFKKERVSYPFDCAKCGKTIINRRTPKSRAHSRGICRIACDGIQRNGTGRVLTFREQQLQLTRKIAGDTFFASYHWKKLRYRVLVTYGKKCQACGAVDSEMHVDHIKPRSIFPELALSFDNLQVLCKSCNLGKSNIDQTDWRLPPQ